MQVPAKPLLFLLDKLFAHSGWDSSNFSDQKQLLSYSWIFCYACAEGKCAPKESKGG